MQQLILHQKLHIIQRIDETEYSSTAYERFEKIRIFEKLHREGARVSTICSAIQTPKSTFYNWRKNYRIYGLSGLENQSRRPNNIRKSVNRQIITEKVLHIRKQDPLYGKNKIATILKRDYGIEVSVSTVGRVISDFIKRGQIKPANFYYMRKQVRPRIFNNHAQRWTKGMKAKGPGELFQIDHMTVFLAAGVSVKHFQGICPITKMAVEEVYSVATSNTAQKFLNYARTQLPFKIKSIQVDGGSEFMGEFEQDCKDHDLPLYVLPPRSPEYNGTVERANAAAKYEFYAFYTGVLNLNSLRTALSLYVKKYNTYRPHQSLQYLTPLEYYQKNLEANFQYVLN